MDTAQLAPDAAEKAKAQAFVDLMIPIVKGWSTENSIDIASLGVQIHGGMGFIEETGAAQHLRDARITAIYEGTTGIQAADLVGRKMARDNGHAAKTVIASMRETAESLKGEEFAALRETLSAGIDAFDRSVQYVVANYGPDVRSVLASSVPLLKLFGIVAGGWQLARSASIAAGHIAAGKGSDFYKTKLITARFYADHVLSQAPGLAHAVVNGAVGTLEISDQAF